MAKERLHKKRCHSKFPELFYTKSGTTVLKLFCMSCKNFKFVSLHLSEISPMKQCHVRDGQGWAELVLHGYRLDGLKGKNRALHIIPIKLSSFQNIVLLEISCMTVQQNFRLQACSGTLCVATIQTDFLFLIPQPF